LIHTSALFSYELSLDNYADLATSGVDYDPIPDPTMVTFMMGNPIQCTTLSIVSDDIDEPEEMFTITATPGSAQISIPVPTVNVFITDDDCESMKIIISN
jgi:hypothetical protein